MTQILYVRLKNISDSKCFDSSNDNKVHLLFFLILFNLDHKQL